MRMSFIKMITLLVKENFIPKVLLMMYVIHTHKIEIIPCCNYDQVDFDFVPKTCSITVVCLRLTRHTFAEF